jgi:hypothetical protein
MNGAGSMQQLLRAACEAVEQRYPKLSGRKPAREAAAVTSSRSIRETSTFRVLEALPDGKDGEKVFKVILISEGPGNRRNKNFYGAEAVESSVTAFEGKWCYLNHQSADEAETLPERRIQDKAGYFKKLAVIKVAEGTACAGELHCDFSESGATLATKIQSALKYKESFPDNGLEYVGFSVNADGDAEPRDMTDRGGSSEDNYVTAITEGDSCDLVTTPARGGRALKESQGGSQEAGMKKKLLAISAVITEALKTVKGDEAKKLTEAQKSLAAIVKEADAEPMESADAYAAKHLAKHEGESDEDHAARLHALAKGIHAHLKGKPAAEADPADDPEDEPAEPKPSADAVEAMKDAVLGLIRESGLPYTKLMIAELVKKPYREAKAQIVKDSALGKSIRESASSPAASFHRGGFSESETDNEASFLEAAQGE